MSYPCLVALMSWRALDVGKPLIGAASPASCWHHLSRARFATSGVVKRRSHLLHSNTFPATSSQWFWCLKSKSQKWRDARSRMGRMEWNRWIDASQILLDANPFLAQHSTNPFPAFLPHCRLPMDLVGHHHSPHNVTVIQLEKRPFVDNDWNWVLQRNSSKKCLPDSPSTCNNTEQ